jgi:hypothetical protein
MGIPFVNSECRLGHQPVEGIQHTDFAACNNAAIRHYSDA